YFGVCVLLSTLPGLPMFGHGQVEGLREKYGMEYERPRWDEATNEALVQRHEREIFPLLRAREAFAHVAHFLLFDCRTDGGTNEDVIAYANGHGSERAIVTYNNRWREARGWLSRSTPVRDPDSGDLFTRSVWEALGVDARPEEWIALRCKATRLERLVSASELRERGLRVELGAFKYHVWSEPRVLVDSKRTPCAALARDLGARPVQSIDCALEELALRAVHDPLRALLDPAHAEYVARASPEDATHATISRVVDLANGVSWLEERDVDPRILMNGTAKAMYWWHTLEERDVTDTMLAPLRVHARSLVWAIAAIAAVMRVLTREDEEPRDALARGRVKDVLAHVLMSETHDDALADAAARLALVSHATLETDARPTLTERICDLTANDPDARVLLLVHDAGGTTWFNKERMELVAAWLDVIAADGSPRAVARVREEAAKARYDLSLFSGASRRRATAGAC
ncbi:MAG: hypothetical protein ACHREM_32390, partial [Polyangiales bacterium]